ADRLDDAGALTHAERGEIGLPARADAEPGRHTDGDADDAHHRARDLDADDVAGSLDVQVRPADGGTYRLDDLREAGPDDRRVVGALGELFGDERARERADAAAGCELAEELREGLELGPSEAAAHVDQAVASVEVFPELVGGFTNVGGGDGDEEKISLGELR